MKKTILTATAVFAFAFANAQENAIKANPLAILGGTDLVSFEHKLTENSSAVIGAGISSFDFGVAKYKSTGLELQYRYYFNEAITGLYAAGLAGSTTGKVEDTYDYSFGLDSNSNEDTKFNSLKIGVKGGYQWIWSSGFLLDINLGLAYNKFNYSGGNFEDLRLSGILPNFGLGLGYSF